MRMDASSVSPTKVCFGTGAIVCESSVPTQEGEGGSGVPSDEFWGGGRKKKLSCGAEMPGFPGTKMPNPLPKNAKFEVLFTGLQKI